MAAIPLQERQPNEEVASKVLRRAQVSKMTRTLQDRLALANVKIQHGWQDMPLALIEPQIEQRLHRKRPGSSHDTLSDSASSTSTRVRSSSGLESSPLTAPMFSDDFHRIGESPSKKRIRAPELPRSALSGPLTGRRQRLSRQSSWKRDNYLPESSPIHHSKHARFASSINTSLSFISECSTVPDSPPSPVHSEDDDADLPVTSFSVSATTRITSSPPRTPPPDRRMRKAHTSNVSWSRTPKTGEGDADLLLYLTTSPSPAVGVQTKLQQPQPPATPPCKSTPLPSSHMTPGTSGAGFLGFGPHTPGTNFNFADFVNVTPSPAQGHWTRTPAATGWTPAATREARRRLNFDTLAPPPSSVGPNLTRTFRETGLGMELGGDLVS